MVDQEPNSSEKSKLMMIIFPSHQQILEIKEQNKKFLRSCLIVVLRPFQIQRLFSLINLLNAPSKTTFCIKPFSNKKVISYITYFIIDTDISDVSQTKFNDSIASKIAHHKAQIDLLRETVEINDIKTKLLRYTSVISLYFGKLPGSLKKYFYNLENETEIECLIEVMFSHPKIVKLDYTRDSIIPKSKIMLGKSLSRVNIGLNSHVLFLTGNIEVRQSIISTILEYYTSQDQFHIVVFDFGLNFTYQKINHRKLTMADILFDPFLGKDNYDSTQRSLFISHMNFIGRSILRFNERQIFFLEDKLSSYLQVHQTYSWRSFLDFIQSAPPSELLTNPAGLTSFSTTINTTDFTSMLKTPQDILKTPEIESLLIKLKYLESIFCPQNKLSLSNMLYKNHLDIVTLSTTPEIKSLFFYVFNLFYSLNDSKYKNYIFMFLDINSILFDKFTEFDISLVHPDLKRSLFDSSEIDSVKKIVATLETRIYTSYHATTQYNLLSKNTKESIEKLQYLHGFSLLESPQLQRPEFFKLNKKVNESGIELPPPEIFITLCPLFLAPSTEFNFRMLFCKYGITRAIKKGLVKSGYLGQSHAKSIFTKKGEQLKQTIIKLLSFQPALNIDEHNTLIKFSDPVLYNVFTHNDYWYDGDLEALCTRYLVAKLQTLQKGDFLLLYKLLEYQNHLVSLKDVFLCLIASVQSNFEDDDTLQPESTVSDESILENQHPIYPEDQHAPAVENQPKKEEIVYQTELVEEISVPPEILSLKLEKVATMVSTDKHANENNSNQVEKYAQNQNKITPSSGGSVELRDQIQEAVDIINKRIKSFLPDKDFSFPENPIFQIIQFLNPQQADIILNDLFNLRNIASPVTSY